MRLTAATTAYIAMSLAEQGLFLAGIEVETGSHCHADHGIDRADQRRPDHAKPQGRKHDREQRQGRVVGHVAEEVELAADDDRGTDQRHIHAAEEQQPAPRHPAAPPEPPVDKPVERDQRHVQQQVLLVGGPPELRPVGQFGHGDDPDDPARPHRDPRGVQHHVAIGADRPQNPSAHVGPENARAPRPPQRSPRCCGNLTGSIQTSLWH